LGSLSAPERPWDFPGNQPKPACITQNPLLVYPYAAEKKTVKKKKFNFTMEKGNLTTSIPVSSQGLGGCSEFQGPAFLWPARWEGYFRTHSPTWLHKISPNKSLYKSDLSLLQFLRGKIPTTSLVNLFYTPAMDFEMAVKQRPCTYYHACVDRRTNSRLKTKVH
jgi:hypothetical protein